MARMFSPDDQDTSQVSPGADTEQAIPLARPVSVPVARAATEDAMLLGRLSGGRAAFHLALLFVVLAMYLLIVTTAVGTASDGDPESEMVVSPALNLGITFAGEVLLISLALLMLRGRRYGPRAIGASSRLIVVDVALGIAVTAISFGVFICSVQGMIVLWPEGFAQMSDNWEHVEAMLPPMSLGTAFALMLVIGVLEELIFRGILLTHLRRITRSWIAAAVISGAVFAALHIGDQATAAVVPLFLVSLVWSGFTIWRRSLLPSIVGHALFNFLQFAALSWAETRGMAGASGL